MALHIESFVERGALARMPRLLLRQPGDAPFVAGWKRLAIALLVLALGGAGAAAVALVKGHHVMGTTSEMPWGILIATYVFFVVSSTGLCLVSSLGHVFGFELFAPLAKRAVLLALVTLVVGFSVIATELERPFLLLRLAIVSPNPTSPIWWMGALYGVYMVLIAVELGFLLIDDHRRARFVGALSVVAALAAHSNLGAVFGLSHSRPFWYGPLLPVYFIASALMCGAALLVLLVWFDDYFGNGRRLRPENAALFDALRRLLALFVGVVAFFTVWKLITGVNGAHYHKYEVTMASLSGPLFVSFWLFESFLGVVVPLTILLGPRGKSPRWVALAASLLMAAVLVMRINFVYEGQMLSLRPVVGHLGEQLRYSPPFKGSGAGFLPYTPSLVEVMIVAGAIAAAILLYAGGTRILKLRREG